MYPHLATFPEYVFQATNDVLAESGKSPISAHLNDLTEIPRLPLEISSL